MKKYSKVLMAFIFVISLMFIGCVNTSEQNQVSVLVTIVPQVEMVSAIGGEQVDITVLVPPGESPHSFEPTPHQMTKVAQASAYFIVGSGVEFEVVHMDTILEQNQALLVFDCSENISVLSFDQHYGKEEYREEDDEHDHEGTDPHIWTSPVNMKKMAERVYSGLVDIDPAHQDQYYQNYLNYSIQLDSLHQNISTMLDPYEDRSFMVYHPAWGYFGDAYHLKMIAIEDEGKQPGPAGVAAIIQQAKNESIRVIFVSPQFDTSSAETIAKEIDGQVVYANPLMNDYYPTLKDLADALVDGYTSV